MIEIEVFLFIISFVMAFISMLIWPEPVCINFILKIFGKKQKQLVAVKEVAQHRWSGWPGAWCLDCGQPDPAEMRLAGGYSDEELKSLVRGCPCPGSGKHDPYANKQRSNK